MYGLGNSDNNSEEPCLQWIPRGTGGTYTLGGTLLEPLVGGVHAAAVRTTHSGNTREWENR